MRLFLLSFFCCEIYKDFDQLKQDILPAERIGCLFAQFFYTGDHFSCSQKLILPRWNGSFGAMLPEYFTDFGLLSGHYRQFLLDPYCTVSFCLFAFLCIKTFATIFTLIDFFLTSICISFYRFTILQVKCFHSWTSHAPIFINFKIDCTKRIFVIVLVDCFFF